MFLQELGPRLVPHKACPELVLSSYGLVSTWGRPESGAGRIEARFQKVRLKISINNKDKVLKVMNTSHSIGLVALK